MGSAMGLKKKYKPRDSGVSLSDDEGVSMNMGVGFGMRKGGTLGASGSIGGMADFPAGIEQCQLCLFGCGPGA